MAKAPKQRTLALTSPHMHGPDVLDAQKRLRGANRFHHDYLGGKPGDVWNEHAAQGARTAKHWLGYKQSAINGSYGEALDAYLAGRKRLTPAMVIRRRGRRKAYAKQALTPVRAKAFNILAAHVGEKEQPPNSNNFAWATDWFGIRGPWCAMSASRAYSDAGSVSFRRGSRYAYVPAMVADARAGANNLSVTQHPEKGDLVCFDWDGDGTADHVGLFGEWTNQTSGTFATVEGNTSSDAAGDQSNGGEVAFKSRNRKQVQCFIRVAK